MSEEGYKWPKAWFKNRKLLLDENGHIHIDLARYKGHDVFLLHAATTPGTQVIGLRKRKGGPFCTLVVLSSFKNQCFVWVVEEKHFECVEMLLPEVVTSDDPE